MDKAGNLNGLLALYKNTYIDRLSHKVIRPEYEDLKNMKEKLFNLRYQSSQLSNNLVKFASTWNELIVAIGRGESSILTLRIIFRRKINVNICIEPRNEVKILKNRVLGISIFTQKLTRPPLGRKKNILEYGVYCVQNNRLGHTVPMKQTVT